MGRQALHTHLRQYDSGHSGAAAGLDPSWSGLEAYRYQSPAVTTPYDRVATSFEAATIEGLELPHKGSVAADHAIRPVEILPADVDASVSLELKIVRAAAAVAATEAKLAELRRLKASATPAR